jgi:hypothetical protein
LFFHRPYTPSEFTENNVADDGLKSPLLTGPAFSIFPTRMKAQHRHELHTNQLADWLEKSGERLKPYARLIVGVLVAVAIVLAVYAYLGSVERSNTVVASTQYITALESGMPGELQRVADDYRGSQPATLAQLVKAEEMLDTGASNLFVNKQAARENLLNASEAFAAVEKDTHDPMLRAWALYGIGRAHESLGDLDRAQSDFQQLLKDYPDSLLADAAQTHINRLKQPSIKEFYDWFAKQEPQPPAADKEPGTPGVKPGFNLDEPESVPPSSPGDVKLPSAMQPGDNGPASGATAPGGAVPTPETPAATPSSGQPPAAPLPSDKPITPAAPSSAPAGASK